MGLLSRERAALVVVDVQEGFRGYDTFEQVAGACAKLVEGARILGVPVLATEQYPKGLGPTAPEVGLGGAAADREDRLLRRPRRGLRPARAAARRSCAGSRRTCASARRSSTCSTRGLEVHVPADAVGSRHRSDYELGLRRMDDAGAQLGSVESVLFELLERAGTPEFKAVQKLIV